MKRHYTFIDLFAGAGGLSEGFIRAGFDPIAHIEMDHHACDTLRTRAAYHYLEKECKLDIYEKYLKEKKEETDGSWLWKQVPKQIIDTVIQETIGNDTLPGLFCKVDRLCKGKAVDLIIGGPPCQAYSIVGRARVGEKIENDPRNDLYKFYVKFLGQYKPKMFVFENVLGIRTAKHGAPFRHLKELVNELGYEMKDQIQVASQHGVLQNRQRVIIVGWLRETEKGGKTTYHYPDLPVEKLHYQVMKDLFSDLPVRHAGEGQLCGPVYYTKDLSEMKYLEESGIRGAMTFTTQHIARPTNLNDREIYRQAVELLKRGKRLSYDKLPPSLQKHKNKHSFLNRFCVVNPNGACHTIVAHIANDGHYYIYPTPEPTVENVRSITIREAARIQSFPDDYFFEGSRTSAFKQIGNAVPVILAVKLGLEIKKILTYEDELRRAQNR